MNLLADESVDGPIVMRLRSDRHQVLYIAEIDPAIPDDEVLARANREAALLLTGDKDFGELVYRQKLISLGVILIRLEGLSPDTKAAIVAESIRRHEHDLSGAFTVISPGIVRIRHSIE